MKDFGDITQTTGTYPDVAAVNDTVPGDKTGTPYTKQMVDELFGVFQAILNAAHLTPNDSAEAAAASYSIESSQIAQAIQAVFMPAGMIVGIPTDTVPTGARLLKLEGQVILRATYPRLVTNVEQSAHSNGAFYRCNAGGTYDAAGDYMLLPDLRGQFLRGRDSAGSVDPDGATREFGNLQDWGSPDHTHEFLVAGSPDLIYSADVGYSSGDRDALSNVTADAFTLDGPVGQGAASGEDAKMDEAESRPTNSITTWCITY